MATGVFSLRKVYIKQYQNVDNRNFASWPEYTGAPGTYGYVIGGFVSTGAINRIDRLDFSNETVSLPGKNVPTTSGKGNTVASALYAYLCSGQTGPGATVISNIQRIDFSTENTSLPVNNIPISRYLFSRFSSNTYGYFGGGYTPGISSAITRLDFSSESISTPSFPFPAARYRDSSANYDNTYVYLYGSDSNAILRLDLSSETSSLPGKNLPDAKNDSSTVFNRMYGYFAGGTLPSISTIRRIDFSTENISLPGNNLPGISRGHASMQSNSYGYFGGGYYPPVVFQTVVVRLDFSSETVSLPGNNLTPTGREYGNGGTQGGASVYRGSKTYGYFGGGGQINGSSTIVKLDFSTENVSTLVNNLRFARYGLAATSSNFYGYFAGGFDPGVPTFYSVIDRLDFSNETISLPGKNLPAIANLPGARRGLTATLGNSYGYFGGGITPNGLPVVYVSIITRLDFSSETISDPGKNFPNTIGFSAATSSNAYGYFGGGYIFPPNFYSTITRLDFSSETISNPGKNLPTGIAFSATNSNNSYGYFIGGSVGPTRISNINRLDLSSETLSSPGNNFPTVRANHTATSSNFYGYFGGGTTTVDVNTISRIDFSNETFSNPGKNLPQTNVLGAAVSNSN